MATADEEDDCDDTSSDGRDDNPNDDRFFTTGNNHAKSKKMNIDDKEFAKKFIFNMTREQARLYISLSGLVFAVSLFALIKSSS